jgi:LacI family transcriptional regulator
MVKPSLIDIAKKLNVSVSLVSLVLNGHAKDNRISTDMQKKVLKTAEELNYKPNYLARGLRTGKTNTIGLVVSDISNPMFALLGRYIEDEAGKQGYNVFFTSSDEDTGKTTRLIGVLLNKQVDGLLIVPAEGNKDDIINLKRQKVPFVLIDRNFPRIQTNFVGVDNLAASRNAVKHLSGIGYKKIGFITFDWTLSNYRQRYEGYRKGLKESEIRYNSNYVKFINFSTIHQDIRKCLRELIIGKDAVRALFLANNTLCYDVMEYLITMKLRVPQDIALISFDNDPAFAFTYAPLTVIDQPFKEIAVKSVQMLIDHIENPNKKFEQLKINAQLKIRQSCGYAN